MIRIVERLLRLRSTDRALAAEVRNSLVETLFASPTSLTIGAIAGTAAGATIAYSTGDRLLTAAAATIGLVGAARIASAFVYRGRAGDRDSRQGGAFWEMVYEAGAWSYALMLGVITYLTLTRTHDVGLHLLAGAVATGYAAGISGRNAGRPVIAIGQVTLTALPMSLALFQNDDWSSLVLAVLNLLFIAGLIDITTQTYAAFREAFSSKHEKMMLAQRFERLARIDTLTGIENRFAFQERIEMLFAGPPEPGKRIAIFWIDIDRFKEINDTLGHPVGDQVLRRVGERLRLISDGRGHVGRFGGDEFVMAAIVSDAADAIEIAEAVLQVLADPVRDEAVSLDVRASMGIALTPDHGTDPDQLLKHADLALYYAKAAGRARFCLFEPSMQQRFEKTRDIEAGLRTAISAGELDLAFQPIIDVQTSRTRSCEALLRWNHPQLGDVKPSEFVPIAEAIGMMPQITDWVLHRACQAASRWPDHVRVAINVSPVSFKDPDFPLKVLGALNKSGLDAQRLELEITETVLVDENEQSSRMLRELRMVGVRLSLDDFGTGYSSLAYIRRYAFDTIKIDTSFVSDLDTSKEAKAIVAAVVGLADALQVETVAEGVETVQQLRSIRSAGCTAAQGYLIGMPTNAERTAERLAREMANSAELGGGEPLPQSPRRAFTNLR